MPVKSSPAGPDAMKRPASPVARLPMMRPKVCIHGPAFFEMKVKNFIQNGPVSAFDADTAISPRRFETSATIFDRRPNRGSRFVSAFWKPGSMFVWAVLPRSSKRGCMSLRRKLTKLRPAGDSFAIACAAFVDAASALVPVLA